MSYRRWIDREGRNVDRRHIPDLYSVKEWSNLALTCCNFMCKGFQVSISSLYNSS